MNFPLKRHPGSVVFVDDDENFLEVMKTIFPPEWNIIVFANAGDFVEYMQSKMAVSKEIDAYQLRAIERLKKGGAVALEVARFWNSFPERYSLPQVVIVDYHMPSLNGLDALEMIKEWDGQKILLTGVADESLICRAFNERRIDFFIAKQNARIMQQIASTLKLMLNDCGTSDLKWDIWNLSLRSEQNLIIQEPEIATALFEFVGDNCEHVVIGEPFGVMALGYDGGVRWLQLETTATLDAAADLALEMKVAQEDARDIRSGRVLSNARINSALRIYDMATVAASSFQTRIPCINEMLYGAVFKLDIAGFPPPELCYSAWHTRDQMP